MCVIVSQSRVCLLIHYVKKILHYFPVIFSLSGFLIVSSLIESYKRHLTDSSSENSASFRLNWQS